MSCCGTGLIECLITGVTVRGTNLSARGREDVGAARCVQLEARPLLARQLAGLNVAFDTTQWDDVDWLSLLFVGEESQFSITSS
jgi:hypothetical protein